MSEVSEVLSPYSLEWGGGPIVWSGGGGGGRQRQSVVRFGFKSDLVLK